MKSKAPRSISKRAGRADLFAILLACWLFVCVGLQFHPMTPDGVQCPTAPVQSVLVPIKVACGCVVGYRARAPKPGEKGFVQCRCAEKKSGHHLALSAPQIGPLVASCFGLSLPLEIVTPFQTPVAGARFGSVSTAPLARPPALA